MSQRDDPPRKDFSRKENNNSRYVKNFNVNSSTILNYYTIIIGISLKKNFCRTFKLIFNMISKKEKF